MGMLDELKKDLQSATAKGNTQRSTETGGSVEAAMEAGIMPSLFSALGSLYINMVSTFSDIDLEVIESNDALILNGLRQNERYVPFAAAGFLASNFAYILAMLATDYNKFRDFVFEGIDNDVSLDKLSDDKRAEARSAMNKKPLYANEHGMEIGVTNFSNNVCVTLREYADKSFSIISKTKAEEECNRAIESLSPDDRKVLGVIFSEYIYFIRAFVNNSDFARAFIDRVSVYKKAYGLA